MSGLPSFDELYRRADERAPRVPVVVAGGNDPTIIEALARAAQRGWVAPLLAGPAEELHRSLAERQLDPRAFPVLPDASGGARAAVQAVRAGLARVVMKGRVSTPELLRAMLDPDDGLRTDRPIIQVVLMEVPRDDRRFLMADTGILPRPDDEQAAAIVRHVVEVGRALGVAAPRVALMAASETVSPHMPETGRAAALAARLGDGAALNCVVQGPLSFDLAYAPDAGARKRVGGPVVGAADAMVFPDLLSANLTVKAVMYTADCRFGGVLRGAACPVVFMSRADRVETRLNSLALALALRDTP